MTMSFTDRLYGACQRRAARIFYRRPWRLNLSHPVVSFTFDDFPRSALFAGGEILRRAGGAGTFYAAFGLMGTVVGVGEIFLPKDLRLLLNAGHELGCHTFAHSHSWRTRPSVFERSVLDNAAALRTLIPGLSFKTFSYPISHPRPRTKERIARYFAACRGGGQTFNADTLDLNYLSAYFLEKAGGNAASVANILERNRRAGGWLIFATHDISDSPSPYGVTPAFFEETVRLTIDSGARILTVAGALQNVLAS
jgi:peptidoglycan/xylan/chitin deacetylase (PgdA/CDA1 family)